MSMVCPEGETSRDDLEPSKSMTYMSKVLAAARAETIRKTTAAICMSLIVEILHVAYKARTGPGWRPGEHNPSVGSVHRGEDFLRFRSPNPLSPDGWSTPEAEIAEQLLLLRGKLGAGILRY